MFKRLVCLILLFFSNNSFSLEYSLLFPKTCEPCVTTQNKDSLSISKEFTTQKNGMIKIRALMINKEKFPIAFPEVSAPDVPLAVFSLDLNSDGFLDLAFNHRSGIANKYFYYFLFDPNNKKYELLGEFPELRKNGQSLTSTEYDGPKTIEKFYQFKDNKLLEK